MDTKKKKQTNKKKKKTDTQKEKKQTYKKKKDRWTKRKKDSRQKEKEDRQTKIKKNRQTNKEQTVDRDHKVIIFASLYTIIKKTKWVISFYWGKIKAISHQSIKTTQNIFAW